jgi:cytochrome c oxidase subunit 2
MLALPGLGLVLAGCGSKQDALEAHSKAARGIASLWWIMLAGAVVAFGVIAGILFLAWIRRSRPGIPGVQDGDRAALRAVIGLGVVLPIVVLAALFVFADILLLGETSPLAARRTGRDRPAMTIRVTAHQFWWEVRYPGTRAVTANEIHIPARTNVEVLVHSRDVIHSLWVPELNRKIDVLPDQTNRVLLHADQLGRYRGQCAEVCGLQHAHMGLYVIAESPADFRTWLARQSRPAARGAKGAQLFADRCGSCHTIRGTSATGTAGPDLTHVASRSSLAALALPNTPSRLAQWIRSPQRSKPGSLMPAVPLTGLQISTLVRYLEKLR